MNDTSKDLSSANWIATPWRLDRRYDLDVADSVSMWTSDRSMVLDLDVGGSPDSVMTLALAAANTALALVVTNDEQDGIRARFARRLLDLCGREDVPVVAGRDLGNRDGDLSRYVSDDVPAQSADLVGAVADVLRHTDGHADWINVGASSNLAILVEEHRQLTENMRVLQTGSQREVSLDLPAARTVLAATGLMLLRLVGSARSTIELDPNAQIFQVISKGRNNKDFAALELVAEFLGSWFDHVHPTACLFGPALLSYTGAVPFIEAEALVGLSDNGRIQNGDNSVRLLALQEAVMLESWTADRLAQLISIMEYQ